MSLQSDTGIHRSPAHTPFLITILPYSNVLRGFGGTEIETLVQLSGLLLGKVSQYQIPYHGSHRKPTYVGLLTVPRLGNTTSTYQGQKLMCNLPTIQAHSFRQVSRLTEIGIH